MLIWVQTLEATYSIVATGRKTEAIHDELYNASGTRRQRRGSSDPAHHQSPHYHNTHQGTEPLEGPEG
jgi:hypothetical protein